MICTLPAPLSSGQALALTEGVGDTISYDIRFFERIDEAMAFFTPRGGGLLFTGPDYARVQEQAPPRGFTFFYGVVSADGVPGWILFFQHKGISGTDSIKPRKNDNAFKRWLRGGIKLNTLVCGSLLNSGETSWRGQTLPDAALMCAAMSQAVRWCRSRGMKVGLQVIKDCYQDLEQKWKSGLQEAGYHPLQAQPAMWMSVPAQWETMDDYLEALNSKARIRVKRARKKGAELDARWLTDEELLTHQDDLYRLYLEVAERAGFNTFILPKHYFGELNKQLKGRCRIKGYYQEGKLIGFFTLLCHESVLETHFLGLEHQYNATHQLYLNMLFDMLEVAISTKCSKINFARTALEIKSSVGAVPVPLTFFVKASNPLINRYFPALYRRFTPDEPWTQRHPFKGEGKE